MGARVLDIRTIGAWVLGNYFTIFKVPEWMSITYEQVLNYVQSINEDEEPQYPENLNNSQKARYRQKFSKDFIVEQLHND